MQEQKQTLSTKEQETRALARIMKIIADLGENSYLAAAFDGCYEDARRNIEDDAAYSMKSRLESAEKQIDSLRSELNDSNRKLFESQQTAQKQVEALETELAKSRASLLAALTVSANRAALIPSDSIMDGLIRICKIYEKEAGRVRVEQADKLVWSIDESDQKAMQYAKQLYTEAKQHMEELWRLRAELERLCELGEKEMIRVQEIDEKKANEIIRTGMPEGKFVCLETDTQRYCAIDSTGEVVTRHSSATLHSCVDWLVCGEIKK